MRCWTRWSLRSRQGDARLYATGNPRSRFLRRSSLAITAGMTTIAFLALLVSACEAVTDPDPSIGAPGTPLFVTLAKDVFVSWAPAANASLYGYTYGNAEQLHADGVVDDTSVVLPLTAGNWVCVHGRNEGGGEGAEQRCNTYSFDPPAGDDEPFFGDSPLDVLLWEDSFESYVNLSQFGQEWNGTSAGSAGLLTFQEPGRNGSKSFRMPYGNPDDGYGNSYVIGKTLANHQVGLDHFFMQTWFRVDPVGWSPASHHWNGIKAWMILHPNEDISPRYQMQLGRQVRNPNNCVSSSTTSTSYIGWGLGRTALEGIHCTGFVWEGRLHDAEPIPWSMGSEPASRSPWPNGLNDGTWHRLTWEIKAFGSPQYMRVWVDGILAWDDSGAGNSYPKPWLLRFMGNYAQDDKSQRANGAFYWDHFVLWRRNTQ
jgi:hypothetical protein